MTRAAELINSVVEMGGGLIYQRDLLLAWPREKLDPLTGQEQVRLENPTQPVHARDPARALVQPPKKEDDLMSRTAEGTLYHCLGSHCCNQPMYPILAGTMILLTCSQCNQMYEYTFHVVAMRKGSILECRKHPQAPLYPMIPAKSGHTVNCAFYSATELRFQCDTCREEIDAWFRINQHPDHPINYGFTGEDS